MRVTWKVMLPAVVAATMLLAAAGLEVLPGIGADAQPDGRLLALAIGLVLVLVVVGVSVDRQIRRPLVTLSRVARAPFGPEGEPVPATATELANIGDGIRALHARVHALEAELRQAAQARTRAEQAAQLGEERLALAVRGSHDGLWERDLENQALLLSARWKSMLGYAEDEFPNRIDAWRACVHPDDVAAAESAFEAHLRGLAPRYERQLRLRHKDGRYRWILSRGNAVRHANGRAYRFVGLDTDVSAIKRVEYVLAQVVEGTAGTYGDDFFHALVQHFAAALEVPCAFITECADQPPTRVRTLAFWSSPRFLDTMEYELPGTPCETVIREGRTCLHRRGLEATFPVEAGFQSYLGVPIFGRDGQVLGHLAFLDQKEMDDGMLVDAVFRIFAARAAAELERKALITRLAEQFG